MRSTSRATDTGRSRQDDLRHDKIVTGDLSRFINPYPWMSAPEALVHLDLERRHVPFMWRYFDGSAPTFQANMPDFVPEFTLSEYHIVILILGNFFTDMPGVLDRNALAASFLTGDGWTVAMIWEQDIRRGPKEAVDAALPALVSPTIIGGEKTNPFGRPDLMSARRAFLKGQGLRRKRFLKTESERKSHPHAPPPRRHRHGRRFARGPEESV